MKTFKLLFVFFSFFLVSCSVMDISHSYKSASEWELTRDRTKYDVYANEKTRFRFSYILNEVDTLNVYFRDDLKPFLVGLPIAPVVPNVLPIYNGRYNDGFSLEVRCSKSWSLNLSKIRVYGISTRKKKKIGISQCDVRDQDTIRFKGKDSSVGVNINTSRFHIKYLFIHIDGLEIDGVQQSVPPLLLSRKRSIMYRPLIHPFMFR